METAITGIVYPDMLQQFLIPQLDEDNQERRIHFQQEKYVCHFMDPVDCILSVGFANLRDKFLVVIIGIISIRYNKYYSNN
jgi:hypothetical protein